MQLTNKKNLPDIIMRAVLNDPYNAGDSDFTATSLIKPAHQAMLQRKHADEITEDASERLFALFGSAHHYILEQAADNTEEVVERRYFTDFNGFKISAQIDHLRDGVLSDWKLTSAYKVKLAIADEPEFDDWEQQLNIAAYILRRNGIEINELRIGAMVRDWTPYAFKTEEGYPDQIEYIEIPLWDQRAQADFIEMRINAMAEAAPCSQKERWQPPTKYAVKKVGGSRALPGSISDSFEQAFRYCEDKGFVKVVDKIPENIADLEVMIDDKHEIEERTGPNRRCEGYCNVNQFCEFYKANYALEGDEDVPF